MAGRGHLLKHWRKSERLVLEPVHVIMQVVQGRTPAQRSNRPFDFQVHLSLLPPRPIFKAALPSPQHVNFAPRTHGAHRDTGIPSFPALFTRYLGTFRTTLNDSRRALQRSSVASSSFAWALHERVPAPRPSAQSTRLKTRTPPAPARGYHDWSAVGQIARAHRPR